MADFDPPSRGLRAYQRLKLDLADTVRDLIALARERRDEHLQQAGRDLLARLATDRFDVAVLGQFSRGKSTLMNAVMGHPYLPTGPRPTTSLVTSVRFGSRPRALVHREGGGLPFEIGIAAVAEYVAGLAGRSGDVAGIDVELPAEGCGWGSTSSTLRGSGRRSGPTPRPPSASFLRRMLPSW